MFTRVKACEDGQTDKPNASPLFGFVRKVLKTDPQLKKNSELYPRIRFGQNRVTIPDKWF